MTEQPSALDLHGRALDIEIARALGWTVERTTLEMYKNVLTADKYMVGYGSYDVTLLIDPEGQAWPRCWDELNFGDFTLDELGTEGPTGRWDDIVPLDEAALWERYCPRYSEGFLPLPFAPDESVSITEGCNILRGEYRFGPMYNDRPSGTIALYPFNLGYTPSYAELRCKLWLALNLHRKGQTS